MKMKLYAVTILFASYIMLVNVSAHSTTTSSIIGEDHESPTPSLRAHNQPIEPKRRTMFEENSPRGTSTTRTDHDERKLDINNKSGSATDVTATKILSGTTDTSSSKGIILVKGDFGSFLTISSMSSITSVQAAAMDILQALPESSGSETFVAINSNAKRMRFG